MKKLLMKVLASISAALGIVLMGATLASAQTITNGTGNGSVNTVTNTSNTNISITNSNDVDCNIDNNQNASSGNAQANGNAAVGNVSTGNASNTSSLSCLISASNGPRPARPVPGTPSGDGGAGVVSGVSTRQEAPRGSAKLAAASIEALPATGVNSVMMNLIGVVAGFVSVTIMWQLGLSLYRRYALGQFSSGFAV